MARPKKKIDEKQVRKLAKWHCTHVEIAAFFECDVKTITNRFSKILDACKETGKIRLRRMQWKSAGKGDVKMLIWLGKQYLGQRDEGRQIIDGVLKIKHDYGNNRKTQPKNV